MKSILLLPFCFLLIIPGKVTTLAQENKYEAIDISGFEDDIRHWKNGPGKGIDYERHEVNEIEKIADNLLKFQNADGGWPKNVDWLGKLKYDEVWTRLSNFERKSTCDNRNTYTQIEYLSKVYTATNEVRYRYSAVKGLNFILSTQNENGGWRGADVDAITYNDDLMTGIMNLFLDIEEGRPYYTWIDKDMMRDIKESLRRAIDVTLKCQIIVNNKKTGWCQQHDNKTLLPVKARSYELPSIASLESTSVVEFLMRIKHPDQKIIEAINGAVAWLEESKIYGIRLERIILDNRDINESYKRYDIKVIADQDASPIWARYYEIETNRPFFCNRDGIKVYKLDQVAQERRIGYAWYGYWPVHLLNDIYPAWLKKVSESESGNFSRDTSYTVYSAYQKVIKDYPFIKKVNVDTPENVVFEKDIVYTSYGNRNLHLDLFYPAQDDYSPHPAIILIHGGGWRSGDKTMLHPIAIRLAENGYTAVSVEYRLSPEKKYPAAIYDLKTAVKWLKENSEKYNIDTNKIAVLGCSAGGTLASFLGVTNGKKKFELNDEDNIKYSSNVQAIVDIDGILDFTDPAESGKDSNPENPSAGKQWLGFSYEDNPEIWTEASPLTYVNDKTPPMLFINSSINRFHAGRDEAIQILKDHSIYNEVHTISNTPHSFWLFEPWFEETISLTLNFLDRLFKS